MARPKSLIPFLLILFISCSSGDKANNEKAQSDLQLTDTIQTIKSTAQSDEEFKKDWITFVNAVLAGDLKTLKGLSSGCIYCTDCVTNSHKEDSLFSDFQNKNPDTWYARLNSEFYYISIDKFLREDLTIVFDSISKSRMLNDSKIRFHNDEANKDLYAKKCIVSGMDLRNVKILEMFVKVVDPSSETEGMDKAFAFIQTKQGYKFCGYSTIP